MSASEKLERRLDELTEQISNGFPVVSSGADDPMIDGLGALSELEGIFPEIIAVVKAAEVATLYLKNPGLAKLHFPTVDQAGLLEAPLAALNAKLAEP